MSRFVLVFLLACSAVFADSFDCMIALTRQDPSMDWWYAVPRGFVPKVNQISTVSKGEYFRIIPIFRNYALNSNQTAQISFDVEVVRPDGSVDVSMVQCDGFNDEVSSPILLPAQAILNMCFDPEDPYGDYCIKVSAVDYVSNQTNIQQQSMQLKEFAVEPLSTKERDELFFSYATTPAPSRAFSAFLQTEHSFFNDESEPVWSAIWFFKTIFDNNGYLLPHLLDAFRTGTPKQKRDIILVLALMGESDRLPKLSGELAKYRRTVVSGRVPDPYAEITTGKQLDMLWAEFFATGTVRPVRRIISSLALVEHLGTLDRIKNGELDPEQLEVYRSGMLESVFQSALWSLKSNCRQSPLLHHYCVGILHSEELEKPVQSCLSILLESINTQSANENSKEDEK